MGRFLPGDNRSLVVFDAEIAEKLGINAAIILSRIIWSLEMKMANNETDYFKDGRWWMYDTRSDLARYSKLTDKQIKLVLQILKEKKIIQTDQFDKKFAVRRNWFTIDTAALLDVLNDSIGTKSTDSPIGTKGTNTLVRKGPIDGYERDQYIGTKGTNSSLLLRVSSENLSESQTKTPPLANVTPLPVKPRPRKAKTLKHTPDDLEVAKLWLTYATREMSWGSPPASWTPENFAEELCKVREAVNLNPQGLRALLRFIENDRFWVKNAWSPAGLLKKSSNDVRKIDNILKQMKPDTLRQEQKIQTWAPVSEQEINNPFG